MNEKELRTFVEQRKPYDTRSFDIQQLVCYGCAHSASGHDFPGRPSGERPCCSCVRNPEREEWRSGKPQTSNAPEPILIDDEGNARCFNPFAGFAYNGAPYVYFPMDNYVTLAQRDQEDFYEKHPEYAQAVRVDASGNVHVVKEDEA